jgi:hypothetical protein
MVVGVVVAAVGTGVRTATCMDAMLYQRVNPDVDAVNKSRDTIVYIINNSKDEIVMPTFFGYSF